MTKKILCSRCKKNEATMTYAESVCQECYNKQMKDNGWYKKGYEDGVKSMENKNDK